MVEQNKLMSMREAVEEFVKDGDTVYIGGFIKQDAYSAVHEIIRQGKRDLTISTAVGVLFPDMLAGAGCIRKLITSYTGNPLPRPAHAFKRALDEGIPRKMEIEDHSVLSLSLAYFAGALDLPFIGCQTIMGSGMQEDNPLGESRFKIVESPFDGRKVCLVPPIKHDVGILQVQRADSSGNGQSWGVMADSGYGINSCKKVILCVEEVVDRDVIRSDPNRTIIPGIKVNAVVEDPWGSHPSFMPGHYDIDWEYLVYYEQVTRTKQGFEEYLDRWVYGVKDRKEYMKLVGEEKMQKLSVGKHMSGSVNYGQYNPWEVYLR